MTTPRAAGFRMPPEWAPHASTWVAWPSHVDLWNENLEPARAAFARLVAAIADGEMVEVLVPDEVNARVARHVLGSERVRFHRVPFGDIWLRDTAPLFLEGPRGTCATVRFAFNGWGGKYVLEDDDRVGERIAALAEAPSFVMPWVMEGGAVDTDGEGTALTTRQCLLNPNRNPRMTEREVERAVEDALGCQKVLWLGDGLENDHTDGHVDTIARFVAPGVVVVMEPRTSDDPNRRVLETIARDVTSFVDARGRPIEVVRIPSPGRVADAGGRALPASYANFYIANAAVVVPTYGSRFDDEACTRLGALFPGRRVAAIDARAILTGGGAFHCITQQQPRLASPAAGASGGEP